MEETGPGPALSPRVENYIRYRPRYPRAVLDLLKSECLLSPLHVIADVGAGTGNLARLFLENGNRVYGVEPDADMRAGAEAELERFPKFTLLAAAAESTTLPDHGVDFVTAGQAFHWFGLDLAKREFARILVPGGWIVAVWNVQKPGGSPLLDALQRFWEKDEYWKHSSERARKRMERVQAYRLNDDLVRRELLEPFFGPDRFEQAVFENPMVCDFERLKGRILSSGNALGPEDPNYPDMLQALERLFHAHEVDGTVTIEHDTRVVYGRLD